MIYAIVFLITLLILRTADIFTKNKGLFWLITLVGLLLPIILYAARDVSVGFDNGLYAEPLFKLAIQTKSFGKYVVNNADIDIIYLGITFFVSKLTHDFFWVHFVIMSVITSCNYFVAYRNRNIAPIWMTMFLFYFLIYCGSINLIRQNLAMAFLVPFFYFLIRGENRKSLFFLILAVLSHRLSIIGGVVSFGILFLVNIRYRMLRLILTVVIYLATIAIVFLLKDILTSILSEGGEGVARYSAYLDRDSGNTIAKLDVLFRLVVSIFVYYLIHLKKINFRRGYLIFHLNNIGIAFLFLNLILPQSSRLSMFFQLILIVSLPLLLNIKSLNSHVRSLMSIIILLFTLGLFFNNVIVHGEEGGDIMPYTSKYLNIK